MAYKRLHHILALLSFAATLSFAQQKERSLDDCIEQALQHNTLILMARTDADVAVRKREEISAKFLPQFTVSADYRYFNDLPYQLLPASVFGGPAGTYKEAQFGVPQVLAANIQGTMPIYNQTLLSGRTTAAIGEEAAEYQLRETKEDVVLEVSNVYYNAQIAANQITFIKGNIRNLEQLIVTTKILHLNQMVKYTDVEKLILQKNILEAQAATAEASFQQVVGVLKLYMGLPQSDSVSISFLPSAETSLEGTGTRIPTEILLAKKLQHLAQSEINGIYAGRYPTLAVYGVYGTNGYAATGYQKFFPVSYVGVQLSLPLFDGGTISSRIDQKTLELQKAELKEKLLLEKNSMDRINARNQLLVHRKAVAMQEENIRLAEKLYGQTQLQFKEGMVTITDVLQADSALRDAQTNYLTALAKLRMTELELKKASGDLL